MKKKSYSLKIAILFSVVFLGLYILSQIRAAKVVKKQIFEYPIVNLSTELDGVITSIYKIDPALQRKNPFQSGVTIDDSLKINLSVGYELKTNSMLNEIISVGTIVRKKTGSKYLSLFKYENGDTLKFEFTICDSKGFEIKSDN